MQDIVEAHPKWDQDRFLAFLLLCAASADMHFTENEKSYILRQVGAEALSDVEQDFNAMSDYQRIQVVRQYKDLYYGTERQKMDILQTVEALFQSDGNYSTTEHNLFLMLRKIL